MAISQYSELKTAVQNWMERSDTEFQNRIPEWLTIVQAHLHYGTGGNDPLRITAMETRIDITVDAQTEDLPAGHLETKRIYLDKNPVKKLKLMSPDRFWEVYASTNTGEPEVFCVEADDYVFGPSPDGSYTAKVLYWKAFDAMSLDADTDWVLTNAPNIYLDGILMEAARYYKDAGLFETAKAAFIDGVAMLNAYDDRKRNSGSDWVIQADNGQP